MAALLTALSATHRLAACLLDSSIIARPVTPPVAALGPASLPACLPACLLACLLANLPACQPNATPTPLPHLLILPGIRSLHQPLCAGCQPASSLLSSLSLPLIYLVSGIYQSDTSVRPPPVSLPVDPGELPPSSGSSILPLSESSGRYHELVKGYTACSSPTSIWYFLPAFRYIPRYLYTSLHASPARGLLYPHEPPSLLHLPSFIITICTGSSRFFDFLPVLLANLPSIILRLPPHQLRPAPDRSSWATFALRRAPPCCRGSFDGECVVGFNAGPPLADSLKWA